MTCRAMQDLGNGDAYEWVVASAAWAAEWATNTQDPFLNVSASLAATYPPFAVDPQTPWPSCDGKHGMPRHEAAAAPWNAPTSVRLAAGESRSFALRLTLADAGPRSRNAALAAHTSDVCALM